MFYTHRIVRYIRYDIKYCNIGDSGHLTKTRIAFFLVMMPCRGIVSHNLKCKQRINVSNRSLVSLISQLAPQNCQDMHLQIIYTQISNVFSLFIDRYPHSWDVSTLIDCINAPEQSMLVLKQVMPPNPPPLQNLTPQNHPNSPSIFLKTRMAFL